MWTHNAPPESLANDHPLAFYSFSERAGSVVHNRVASSPDLYIPRIFRVPRKKMLTPPWEEFSPDLSYASDLLINIAGFVPFGFFHFGYLTWNRRWDRAALSTVILGGLLSLTIEILQEYLITRRSGMTDIITNTLGTGVGVMLWSGSPFNLLLPGLRKKPVKESPHELAVPRLSTGSPSIFSWTLAQQPPRMVLASQAALRKESQRAHAPISRRLECRLARFRSRVRNRSGQGHLSHLPRRSLQQGQKTLQRANRRHVSSAWKHEPWPGRLLRRHLAQVGCRRWRRVHARAAAIARHPPAHRRAPRRVPPHPRRAAGSQAPWRLDRKSVV